MTIDREGYKARVLNDIETIFDHPELLEKEQPLVLFLAHEAFKEIHKSACTLRIHRLINDALKQNLDLDLGEEIVLNGFELVPMAKKEGRELVYAANTDDIPF